MSTMMKIFAKELKDLAKDHPEIVGMSADVRDSTGLGAFSKAFPHRFFEMGICEQNMIGCAAGMALEGKKVITSTYACFSPGRTWEQIRNSVCLQQADVKIIGAHIGVGSGKDGATHQCFEDIALMSCLPFMEIFSPATDEEVKLCAKEILGKKGPAYLRLSARYLKDEGEEAPNIFGLRKIKSGKKIAIISTGSILEKALKASAMYEKEFQQTPSLYNLVCLSKLDEKQIIKRLGFYDAILCVEEHQKNGGLYALMASLFASYRKMPPLSSISLNAQFGGSMEIEDLYDTLCLSENHIFNKLKEIRKQVI